MVRIIKSWVHLLGDTKKYRIFVCMKLSIIVPIYNSEKTLSRCIDSILQQSFRDFELLLVDDGSTDRSGRMAEELCLSDDRIRVIHKENGGLSDARNAGMEIATGNYITFVDSDDEVACDTYLKLTKTLKNHPEADILEYPVTERKGCPNQNIFIPNEKLYLDALDWLAEKGLEHCWACNKVFKTSFIKDIRFLKGKHYEDVYFIGQAITRKPKIYTSRKGMYIYHWNDQGIVAKNDMQALLEAQLSVVATLAIHTQEPQWHRLYLDLFTTQLHAYRKTRKVLLYSQKVSIRKYRGYSDIVKGIMLNILGVKLSCILFNQLTHK